MASKKSKGPNDCIPQQERFSTGQDGLVTTTKPTNSRLDYETDSGQEFEITQASSGHESFMYKSTTHGKKEGRE